MNFTALYSKEETVKIPSPLINEIIEEPEEPTYYTCTFNAGEYGIINGTSQVRKLAGTTIENNEIPSITAKKGYQFKGWDISPYNALVDEDKIFTAQYNKILPWYRRQRSWFSGLFAGRGGCLRWLLWLLLFILCLWLLSWLLRGCIGCAGYKTPFNGIVPIDTITRSDGTVFDDNGYSHPITGANGRLPEEGSIVAPILNEDGIDLPISEQPGAPNIIANRLFLFMEDENDNI